MTQNDELSSILEDLRERINRLEQMQDLDLPEYLANWEHRDVAERELEKAARCCLDCAERVISLRSWENPGDNSAVFDVLGEHEVLDVDVAQRIRELAALGDMLVYKPRRMGDAEVHRLFQKMPAVLRAYGRAVRAPVGGLS